MAVKMVARPVPLPTVREVCRIGMFVPPAVSLLAMAVFNTAALRARSVRYCT